VRLVRSPVGRHDARRVGRRRFEVDGLAEVARERPVRREDADEVGIDEFDELLPRVVEKHANVDFIDANGLCSKVRDFEFGPIVRRIAGIGRIDVAYL
jgi:hypothetical protein